MTPASKIGYSASSRTCDKTDFIEVDRCRVCGTESASDVLDLGMVPLANQLIIKSQASFSTALIPLSIFFCSNCYLVQLRQTVSPSTLYSEYPYFSSFSDTMLESARILANDVCVKRKLDNSSLVLEIGSNDGYLLRNYAKKGIPVLGIEPAKNIAAAAQKQGIETVCKFFGVDLARELAENQRKADVIHANNVIAHIASVLEAFQAIRMVLKDEGIAIIEVPYIKPLIDGIEFDTIYHEHVFYFSLTALNFISDSVGMKLLDVEEIPIHGGSIRATFGHSGLISRTVAEQLENEIAWGVARVDTYASLSSQVEALGAKIRDLLSRLASTGKKLAGYGASAKGTTLLNFCQIGDRLDFIVDRSTVKQGCLTPGTCLEILPPSALIEKGIDYTLMLVWNFCDEIIEQQKPYLQGGGAFVVPLPKMRIVRWNEAENCPLWMDL